MTHVADLRRGQIVGDASRRWVDLNTLTPSYIAATYAPIASPSFTGDPKAPTPAPGDNDTSVATTAFVHAAVAAGGGINQLTGDVTAGPGSGSQAATLPNVNTNIGTFQGITVNAKGLVTAAANQSYVTGGPYLALTGGTLTGTLTGPQFISTGGIVSNRAAGNDRAFIGQTNGLTRWLLDLGDTTPEGVANAGSNFQLSRWNDAGSFIDSPITISRAGGAVVLSGTGTNDNAAAGKVGEYVSSHIAYPGAAISSGVITNITSISLTAGDWDVEGNIGFTPAATTVVNNFIGVVGPTSATFDADCEGRFTGSMTGAAGALLILPTGGRRFSLAATTTVYLIAQVGFTTSTCTAYGIIKARRVR